MFDIILPRPPKIPALNRWTLLYDPMVFWLLMLIFKWPADATNNMAQAVVLASLEGLSDIDV
eukprot:11654446-Heterocapsa_arctica.AAC.1